MDSLATAGANESADPAGLAASGSAARANWRLARLWLEALAAERGAVPGTLDTYGDDLACYLGWLAEQAHGSGLALDDVMRDDLIHLDDVHGYAEATVGHRRSVVRTLHRFLITEGLASKDPLLEIAPTKRPKRLPYTPSIDEVDRLLEMARTQAGDASTGLYRQAGYARRAALLEVLYASGMRVSEAVRLPASSIGPKTRAMTIRGKGSKERLVPLHHRAVQAVRWWRRLVKAYGSHSERWLFHAVRDGSAPLRSMQLRRRQPPTGQRSPGCLSPPYIDQLGGHT